ncbi:MAG TPA: DUF2141 domain-containing protein [Allosphingosinicella sp.]|jgi:uncharacterized protein (DUF2141 family)
MTIAISALFLAASAAAPAPASAQLEVTIERLRSRRGQVHICLTRNSAHFPNCAGDPAALKRSVAAGTATVRFDGIQPGAYAVSLFHDENGNGRFDTFAGIPREGFGFSRNPAVRFGAPRFRQVVIDLPSGFARQTVRMQYLL